jgi:hypothetical protein
MPINQSRSEFSFTSAPGPDPSRGKKSAVDKKSYRSKAKRSKAQQRRENAQRKQHSRNPRVLRGEGMGTPKTRFPREQGRRRESDGDDKAGTSSFFSFPSRTTTHQKKTPGKTRTVTQKFARPTVGRKNSFCCGVCVSSLLLCTAGIIPFS